MALCKGMKGKSEKKIGVKISSLEGSLPCRCLYKKLALLKILELEVKEPTLPEDAASKAAAEKALALAAQAKEDEPDSDQEVQSTPSIPIRVCGPCRATVFVETEAGKNVQLRAYVDPGSAGNFISEPALKRVGKTVMTEVETKFSGAIEGTLGTMSQLKVKPTKHADPVTVMAYHKADLDTELGDILLGLPAMIDLGLTMETTPDAFILKFKKQKSKKIIPHRAVRSRGEPKVAATRTVYPRHWIPEAQEDAKQTVNPTEEDWEPRLQHLETNVKEKVMPLLMEFKEQFWVSGYLPPIKNCRYRIDYTGPPFREPIIPLSAEDVEYVNDYFDDQVKQGLVEEVTQDTHRLPYVSNMFIKNEDDGKKRPCINYRKLNSQTVKTEMPIPPKERLIATFAGADAYITTDCKAAYNQLVIDEDSRQYLVVVFPGRDGRRRYVKPTRANFGSSNMPGEYQRISGDLFEDKDVGVYLDDITIKVYKGRVDEALQRFRRVLQTCKEHSITLSFKKTEILKPEVNFLGEILNKDGHRPNPRRVKALQDYPLPTTRKKLRGFLGLYNFLAPLKRHAVTAAVSKLSELTSSAIPYNVNKVKEPFEEAKKELSLWLLLAPYDPADPTFIMTDSSAHGMGGAIFQLKDGALRAVAVCSKKWPKRKNELPAHTKEGLALVTTVRRFEQMLRYVKVTFLTDSANTVDLLTNTDWELIPNLWLRWRRYLTEICRAEILHIPGQLNLAADVLSRQSFTLAVWTAADEEVFFTPLLRNIHDAQQEDDFVKTKRKELEESQGQVKDKQVPEAYFFMQNNLLKRKHKQDGVQIVIPQSMVKKILYLEHDAVLKGHPGRDVMLQTTKQKFYWPTMGKDIADYVTSCLGCQMAKAKLSKKFASHAIRQVSELFAVFSMDLCDMSSYGLMFKYILVTMDDFSSFVILTNLRNKKASTVLKALWDIFTIFGAPESLLSDRGTEFLNDLMKKFTEQMGTQHIITYAYHAQANGRNERSHQLINTTLRILADEHPTAWYKYTKGIQYMMNSRPNIETGISPYEIMFGRKPRTLHNVTPYLEYNHEQMLKVRDAVEETVREHHRKKLQRAARPPPEPLEVGQLVKVVKPHPRRPKYRYPAMGPYRITKRISTSGYELEHTVTKSKMQAPSYWLQIIKTREEDGESGTQPLAAKTAENTAPQPANQPTEPVEEEETDEEEEEEEPTEAEKEPKTKKRALKQLAAYNQVPQKPTETIAEPSIGNMVVVKFGGAIRVAEIREDLDEDWEVHWYGTSSSRKYPRNRWKFFPGFQDAKTGELRFTNAHGGAGKPALGQIRKEDVVAYFARLTVKATLPESILAHAAQYKME